MGNWVSIDESKVVVCAVWKGEYVAGGVAGKLLEGLSSMAR